VKVFPFTEHSRLTGPAWCGTRQLVFDVPTGNPSRRLKPFLGVDPFYLILSRWIDQEHVFPHFARRHPGILLNFEADASEKANPRIPVLIAELTFAVVSMFIASFSPLHSSVMRRSMTRRLTWFGKIRLSKEPLRLRTVIR
jgi:hypothetical protein